VTPRRLCALLVAVTIGLSACSGDDSSGSADGDDDGEAVAAVPIDDALCLDVERGDAPVVELIGPAVAVVDEMYGGTPEYFEVSADRQRVSLIVALDDGTAEQVFFCGDAGRTEPEPLGEAEGSTFTSDAIDIDPRTIFSLLGEQLDDPEIVDFAVTGAGDGAAVYDATVMSESGGVLLVLLSADGEVLAVQAQ
jgi:hypothetical protein